MPFKDPEKKKAHMKEYYEKTKEQRKAYYEKNKEKIISQKKAYYENNKEQIIEKKKAYMKEYYERNKDKIKEYRERNKDKIREKRKEYKKQYYQTENGNKRCFIRSWKKYGLIHDDYDALYEKYINTDKCEVCNKVFENSFDRCLDHDHITCEFRQILCRGCNTHDSWKNKL